MNLKEIELTGKSKGVATLGTFTPAAVGCFQGGFPGEEEYVVMIDPREKNQEGCLRLRLREQDARALANLILEALDGKKEPPRLCVFFDEGRIDELWTNVKGLQVTEVARELTWAEKDDILAIQYGQPGAKPTKERVTAFHWGEVEYKPLEADQVGRQVSKWTNRIQQEIIDKMTT